MKPLYFVSRNNNMYVVAKTKCNHYYIALTLAGKRITAWKRMPKGFIKEHFENYIDTCDALKIYLYDEEVTI